MSRRFPSKISVFACSWLTLSAAAFASGSCGTSSSSAQNNDAGNAASNDGAAPAQEDGATSTQNDGGTSLTDGTLPPIVPDAVAPFTPLNDPTLKLLVTPSTAEHTPWNDAITAATKSIHMVMYHMTDTTIEKALEDAVTRGLDVQVILDESSLSDSTYDAAYTALSKNGVTVIKSSTAFSITHEKAMVVDGTTAFITAMNLTDDYATTRDFGVVTTDASVITEWESVFLADVANAKAATGTTPTLSVPSLVWSPVDSEGKLEALILSAKSTVIATTETLDNTYILVALETVANKGISVRVITPECVLSPTPTIDYPSLAALANKGAQVRVSPNPATADAPYMHSKMILVDGTTAYVGSVNFTANSTHDARETGIIFTNTAATSTIASTFESDWGNAITPPNPAPTNCPKD